MDQGTTGFSEALFNGPADRRAVVEFVSERGFFQQDRPVICQLFWLNSNNGR
jgi:hypothetical protein